MQIGRHNSIQRPGFEYHVGCHCINQNALRFDVGIVFRHFIKNFIPHHHAVTLCVGFGDQRQMLAWTLAREFKGKFVDARHTHAGEDRCFRGDLFGQAAMRATTTA